MSKDNGPREIATKVAIGQVWEHYKGGHYIVVGFSLDEETLSWRVQYENYPKYHAGLSITLPRSSLPPWSRCLSKWFGMADMDGKLVPRFTHLYDVH